MSIAYKNVTEVACEARPYPTYLLENAKTGLCLFSAAFLGHNEAIHFVLEDVQTTCVDIDQEKLSVMQSMYPEGWEFVCRDAWEFAESAAAVGRTWDIVSVDTFRGNATEKSLTTIDLWCSLADTAVVMTMEQGQDYDVPLGWEAQLFRRNSEVFWLVLAR